MNEDPYFKIETIIDLVREQHTERNDIIEALSQLGVVGFPRQAYKSFVPSERPNQTGSDWQFQENLVLEHRCEGTIVLDILQDGRIGGIEMVKYI